MSNTFFMMKLVSIAAALSKHHLKFRDANQGLNVPDDGKCRYIVCSPSVNKLCKPEGSPFNTRMRIALPKDGQSLDPSDYRLERYVDGELTISLKLVEINEDLALAIEAEIYNHLLREFDVVISLM